MRLLPLIASLLFPVCVTDGAAGLPMPSPVVPLRIVRPATPNTALAAPRGFFPPPDIATPLYPLPAARLFATIEKVAAEAPRTYLQVSYETELQADYVARSRAFNFPDLILVAVEPRDKEHAVLILYSRSVYGRSDFGINRSRMKAWLAALDRLIAIPKDESHTPPGPFLSDLWRVARHHSWSEERRSLRLLVFLVITRPLRSPIGGQTCAYQLCHPSVLMMETAEP
jgi:uncharacterized protein (DUF1499 family)